MKINHVALYVEDLEKMKTFYEKYFGATANTMYHNPKTTLRTYFLEFADGCRLEIMTKDTIKRIPKDGNAVGYIHIAISVGSRKNVDEITKQLEKDGFTINSQPRTTGDGYYESSVHDPENNTIEIVE
ncbi:VOC family protein [Breznakiella homolactica]|uniref:VOC family protein n=1 Tax=Breznakiella homolactica TaxID=2798577 RepID=A0A7T7XJW7_9SPIR|nr:VOC family protein [Breznakiella homolactica]QQO07567.1 VOC family protein [Breznakiella homolactica]